MIRRTYRAAVCLLTLAGGVFAAEFDLSDAAAVARLQAELASPDFAVRQSATKRLQDIPLAKMEVLLGIADAAQDAEVRARLMSRVEGLRDQIVTDPPGLAVEIKETDLAGVAGALQKMTGTTFKVQGASPPARYTLQTEGMPLWEIYRRLYGQGSFTFAGEVEYVALRGGGPPWVGMDVHRGFGVMLERDRVVAETYRVHLGFDPRIDVVIAGEPQITGVSDEAGRPWTASVQSRHVPIPSWWSLATYHTLTLKGPANEGKTLNLAGVWPVQIAAEWKSVEIGDLRHPPGDPVVLGDIAVKINHVQVMEGGAGGGAQDLTLIVEMECESARGTAGTVLEAASGGYVRNNGPALKMTLLDDQGKVITTRGLPNAVSFRGGMTVPGKPAKVVLSYPTKIRDYTVPFEFKDVPIRR